MSRTARGQEVLEQAKACLIKAKTVNELRQAQAVVFPLELGLSLEQTAELIGVSEGWACQLRTRFIHNGGQLDEAGPGRGGRRRENLSPEEEVEFLSPFLDKAKSGGILVASEIKPALEERLGRTVSLASVYNLLHRHDWRKLAPDKRHPKSDPAAQEEWKKNCPTFSKKSTGNGRAKGRSG